MIFRRLDYDGGTGVTDDDELEQVVVVISHGSINLFDL